MIEFGCPLQVLLVPVPCSLLLILGFGATVACAVRCPSPFPSVCINPCLALLLVAFSLMGKLSRRLKQGSQKRILGNALYLAAGLQLPS